MKFKPLTPHQTAVSATIFKHLRVPAYVYGYFKINFLNMCFGFIACTEIISGRTNTVAQAWNFPSDFILIKTKYIYVGINHFLVFMPA
jgi:hypothetical protein